MAAFRVLGSNDEQTECDCCGRGGLARTVALAPVDGGPIVRFGVDCAARATGRTRARMASAISAAEHAARVAAWEAARAAYLDGDTVLVTASGKARTIRRDGGAWLLLDEHGAPLDAVPQKSEAISRLTSRCGWRVVSGPASPPVAL